MKKLLTIILTILLSLTNIVCVFADEEEIKEDIQEQEIIEDSQDIEISEQKQPQLLSIGGGGLKALAINYDKFNDKQLLYIYENYNNFENIYLTSDNRTVLFNYYTNTEGNNVHVVYQDGRISKLGTVNITAPNISNYTYIKSNWPNYTFSINPYKLNVINQTSGTIINSVDYEPYASTNIYYKGQYITLTYTNENNDFGGWYINNELVSNQVEYTFQIQEDTTITLKSRENQEAVISSINNMNKTLLCVFAILILILFKNLIWGV